MAVTIYHNPRCSKSRQTLELLESKGITPIVVNYLDTPPDQQTLRSILQKLGLKAHDVIRNKEAAYKELGLSKNSSDDALITAMAENPILIERPIVIAGKKARIGRPPEKVLEIL